VLLTYLKYVKHLSNLFPESHVLHSTNEEQEICVDVGFVVKQADFSANGEVLCVLATGSSTNTAADYVYFYNTGMRPATVGRKGAYEKVSSARFAVRLELSDIE